MKSKHLVLGFHATGIHPIDRNEVIKSLLKIGSDQDVDFEALNDSVLHVHKENCEVGVKQQRIQSKCRRKINPGEPLFQLKKCQTSQVTEKRSCKRKGRSGNKENEQNSELKKSKKYWKKAQNNVVNDECMC